MLNILNNKKMNHHLILKCSTISLILFLTACQPKDSAEKTQTTDKETATLSEQVKDQFVVSKTIPVKLNQSLHCDNEGCTQYEFQTVETNHHWINEYFSNRIKKTDPVAFEKSSSTNPAQNVEEKEINQSSVVVRFVGQNQHLATFEMKTYSYSTGAAHGMYHNEFVNFDLKQKKRIALEDLVVAGAQTKLRDDLYDTNTNWLMAHTIDKDKLNVSDNFYYGANGIVFVYPLYELASYAEGMSELTLPYHYTEGLIKPEYLPNLPKYKK